MTLYSTLKSSYKTPRCIIFQNSITFVTMQNKYVHILFMLLSYAIALGHNAIPHHHFDDIEELEHHHHHDPVMVKSDNFKVLIAEGSHSDDHHHVFCHYSSAGDSKSLAGNDLDLKLLAKKSLLLPISYPGIDSATYIYKQPAKASYNTPHFADSSAHLLSSGLRAPPALS